MEMSVIARQLVISSGILTPFVRDRFLAGHGSRPYNKLIDGLGI